MKKQPSEVNLAWMKFLKKEGELLKTRKSLEKELATGKPITEIKVLAERILSDYFSAEIEFLQNTAQIPNREENGEYQQCIQELTDCHVRLPRRLETNLPGVYRENESQRNLAKKYFDYFSKNNINAH